MNSTSLVKDNRIEWIDSIRGIAALLVVLQHLGMFSGPMRFLSVIDLGKIGVVLFFFVSGFVIPFSLFKYHDKPLSSFCIARFFRLYPSYWISIILALLFLAPTISKLDLFLNITMFQKFFGFDDLLGVYWTLQIELIFYGLCMILFKLGYLQKTRALFVTAYFSLILAWILAAFRFMFHMKFPVALPLAIAVMFIGVIWRKYSLSETEITKSKLLALFITYFASVLPISVLAYNINFGNGESWQMYSITYTVAPTIFLLLTTYLKIRNKLFIFLGQISYSIYLLHLIVIDYLKKYLFTSLTHSEFILVSLALTILFSTVVYYLVEKPFIKYGKSIISNFSSKKTIPIAETNYNLSN